MRKAIAMTIAVPVLIVWVFPLIVVRHPIRWLAIREGIPPKRILLYGWDYCTLGAVAGMNTIVRLARWANPGTELPFVVPRERGRRRG